MAGSGRVRAFLARRTDRRRAAGRAAAYCLSAMADADKDPLDALSSKELHDLAVHHARRHLDVRFFWHLMQVLPAAEAAAGEIDEADADVESLSAHIDDVSDAGHGEVGELLRPVYLDYLRRHGVRPS